jgi:hypothetical protein
LKYCAKTFIHKILFLFQLRSSNSRLNEDASPDHNLDVPDAGAAAASNGFGFSGLRTASEQPQNSPRKSVNGGGGDRSSSGNRAGGGQYREGMIQI